ncbi:hypothetical protein V6N13_071038 [Hibiscus sabdariffa]
MRDHIVLPPVHPSPSNVDGGQDSLGSNHVSSSVGPLESADHKSRVSDGQLRDIVETESAGLQISDNTCSSGELGDTEEPGHNATQGEEILPVVSTTLPGVSERNSVSEEFFPLGCVLRSCTGDWLGVSVKWFLIAWRQIRVLQ